MALLFTGDIRPEKVLHACIICDTQYFLFEFETANQPVFEPRFPRPKESMLTIELHSINCYTLYLFKRSLVATID